LSRFLTNRRAGWTLFAAIGMVIGSFVSGGTANTELSPVLPKRKKSARDHNGDRILLGATR